MDYRDILGFKKKTKKTKKTKKVQTKNRLIESINKEIHNYPIQQFNRLKEQDKKVTNIPDSPFEKDKEDDVKPGSMMNETIPALGREYGNYSKSKKILFKSMDTLSKGAGKKDKKAGKEIDFMKNQLEKTFKRLEKEMDRVLADLQ